MSDFLDSMAASSGTRAAALPGEFRAAQLERPAFPLRLGEFDVIAEIKDRSPSMGALAEKNSSRTERAAQYIKGGAAAISVLTEPSRFGGDLAHLEEVVAVASAHQVPVMRKDFLVETSQILEAKAAGASGVLLIVAMLQDGTLEEMLHVAYEHDLFVLLESFDEDDLQRTAKLLEESRHLEQAQQNKLLVGINSRNLRTLEVDAYRLQSLAGSLPTNAIAVAESGLGSAADARLVLNQGYRMALVGTALMQSEQPAVLLAEMLAAGRKAANR